MNRRYVKLAALVVSGGMLLQLSSCAGGLGATLFQNIIPLILSLVLQAVLGTATTDTTTM